MSTIPRPARRAVLLALAALVLAAAFATTPAPAQTPKPTIVLVHGAFADASSWNAVTERLQKRGYTVAAPANPLRGIVPLPDGTTGQEAIIKPAVFHDIFAADLPARTAAVMAASQRPAALSGFAEPSGVPAWRTIPSFSLVPTRDVAIGTDLERFFAARMHATTVEVKGASHVVMISRPRETERLILRAAGDRSGHGGPGRGGHGSKKTLRAAHRGR